MQDFNLNSDRNRRVFVIQTALSVDTHTQCEDLETSELAVFCHCSSLPTSPPPSTFQVANKQLTVGEIIATDAGGNSPDKSFPNRSYSFNGWVS